MAVSQSNAVVDLNISGALLQNATKSFALSKRYCQIMVNLTMLNILFRRSGCISLAELKCKEFKGVEIITLKVREPEDPVLKYLLFVLKGIKNAISKGFVREIFLTFKHPETLEPLEIYSIVVKYNTGAKKEDCTFASLRESTLTTLKHIKNLDKFDKVPKYTKVKVELTYNENTPVDYQPPGFKEAEKPVCLGLDKQRVVFGILNTGYHKIMYAGRGKTVKENEHKIYLHIKKTDEDDTLDNTPLSKRVKLDEMDTQPSQPDDVEPGQSADPDAEQEIHEGLNTSNRMENEEHEITDENKNVIGSSKRLNPMLSISLISSEDSGSMMETPVKCSLDSISCLCEIDTGMFVKSDIDETQIDRIACDRCRKTYHLPCHGYLTHPVCREFLCVKCSRYNTTDTIIRSMEGAQLRILARCRLVIYLMNKYGKSPDVLMSLFTDCEQDNLMDKFVKFKIMNHKKQVNIIQIQRSANVIFNTEDSQYLF